MEEQRIKQKRVTVYIPEEEYKKLRAKLILAGMSVSEWFRRTVKKLLNDEIIK